MGGDSYTESTWRGLEPQGSLNEMSSDKSRSDYNVNDMLVNVSRPSRPSETEAHDWESEILKYYSITVCRSWLLRCSIPGHLFM